MEIPAKGTRASNALSTRAQWLLTLVSNHGTKQNIGAHSGKYVLFRCNALCRREAL
jgi:hypothetical protein